MVHFPGFARSQLCIHWDVIRVYRIGFPHSEIPGSKPICGSPRLIAACHVLHRLLLPRHPPCALSSLTTKFTQHTPVSRRGSTGNFMSPSAPCVSRRNEQVLGTHKTYSSLADRLHRRSETCNYPMLFSCQTSSHLAVRPPGWLDKTSCPKFGAKRLRLVNRKS